MSKYQKGDELYFMYHNLICKSRVVSMVTDKDSFTETTGYEFDGFETNYFEEGLVYESLEEILAYLLNHIVSPKPE